MGHLLSPTLQAWVGTVCTLSARRQCLLLSQQQALWALSCQSYSSSWRGLGKPLLTALTVPQRLRGTPVARGMALQGISVQGQAITGLSPLEEPLSDSHQIKVHLSRGGKQCARMEYAKDWKHAERAAWLLLTGGSHLAPAAML